MVSVETGHGPHAIVMRVAGDVNVSDVVALRNVIATLSACHVVVDVSDAHRLGPRALALLIDEKALLMRRGGDLRLVLRPGCDTLGLERLFHLHPSVEDALEHLEP